MKIEIKNIFNKVIHNIEADSLSLAVEMLIRSGADLSRANLFGADLSRADLSRANLFGADLSEANLFGANLFDEVKIQKRPIKISTPKYYVLIFDSHMKIGCEFHSIEAWKSFDDKRIIEMDGRGALQWWNKWNKPIMQICDAEERC